MAAVVFIKDKNILFASSPPPVFPGIRLFTPRRPAAAASGARMPTKHRTQTIRHSRHHCWKYEWMYACRLSARETEITDPHRLEFIQQTEKQTFRPGSPPGSHYDRRHNLWIPDGSEWCFADWLLFCFEWNRGVFNEKV